MASRKLVANSNVYPAAVMLIPVQNGPAAWPMSMIEERAPMDAPSASEKSGRTGFFLDSCRKNCKETEQEQIIHHPAIWHDSLASSVRRGHSDNQILQL